MPDVQPTYRAVVAGARELTVALTRRSLADLEGYVAGMLAALIEDAEAASGTNADRLATRSRAVRTYLERLRARIEALEDDAVRAAVIMGDGHSQAVELVAREAGRPTVAVVTSFETVPERAVEALLKRRQLAIGRGLTSYSQVFRSVATNATEGVLSELDRALAQGVARGADARDVALRIAAELTEGEPALRAAVERLSPSLRRSGATLSNRARALSETTDGTDVGAELTRARQVLHKARRIARTEVLDAARAGDAHAARLSPVVAALQWTLSSSHPPTGCECSVFARVDLYGMGAGVFPTNAYPTGPHPHCQCYSRAITRGPDEWGDPKPAAEAPATLERYPFRSRPGGLAYTDAHKERVRKSVNAQLASAFDPVGDPVLSAPLPPDLTTEERAFVAALVRPAEERAALAVRVRREVLRYAAEGYGIGAAIALTADEGGFHLSEGTVRDIWYQRGAWAA